MSNELEELDFTDTIVDFCMLCQKHGVRDVLRMLRQCDREMFEEIKVQIHRLDVPVLFLKFDKPDADSM